MHFNAIIFSALFFSLMSVGWTDLSAVQLTKIDSITFRSGKKTIGRRLSTVPQLKCIDGGTAGCNMFLTPRVVQCKNMGSAGIDVHWKCHSDDMGSVKSEWDSYSLRFGEIYVSCEGYTHDEDPFVLIGSCALEYSLDWTFE